MPLHRWNMEDSLMLYLKDRASCVAKAASHVLLHLALHVGTHVGHHSVSHVRPHSVAVRVRMILVHMFPHIHPHALLIASSTPSDYHAIVRHQRLGTVLHGRSHAGVCVKTYPHSRVFLHRSIPLVHEHSSERRELRLSNLCVITGSDTYEIRAVAIARRAIVDRNSGWRVWLR